MGKIKEEEEVLRRYYFVCPPKFEKPEEYELVFHFGDKVCGLHPKSMQAVRQKVVSECIVVYKEMANCQWMVNVVPSESEWLLKAEGYKKVIARSQEYTRWIEFMCVCDRRIFVNCWESTDNMDMEESSKNNKVIPLVWKEARYFDVDGNRLDLAEYDVTNCSRQESELVAPELQSAPQSDTAADTV